MDILSGDGMFVGGWKDGKGNAALDVVSIGKPSEKTLKLAQDAEQIAVYDVKTAREIAVGKVENGVYTKLDEAANIFAQHQGEVQRATGKGGGRGAQKISGNRSRSEIVIEPTGTNPISIYRQKGIAKSLTDAERKSFLKQRNRTMDSAEDFQSSSQKVLTKSKPESHSTIDIKSDGRMIEKAYDDYGEKGRINFDRVRDGIRRSIIESDPVKLRQIVESIDNEFQTMKVVNRFKTPTDGYRDIQINVRMKNGSIGEFQIQVPEIAKAKESLHVLYERQRQLDGIANKRKLTTNEKKERNLLKNTMQEKYVKAWESYLQRTKASDKAFKNLVKEVDFFPPD